MNKPHNYGSITSPMEVTVATNRNTEFNNLCESVVTNIYTINSSFKNLGNALKNIGTKRDNYGLRNQIHITQLSANQIASATSKDIVRLKSLLHKGNKQQQLQVEKLEENFKEAVGRYYGLQKEVATKQKAHLLVTASIENEDPNFEGVEFQRQATMARDMVFEQEMLLERETRIRQIEADVLDVNEIMRELGSMVHEQGQVLDTIENNIDRAAGNVEEGAEQLIKAARHQTRRRCTLLYLVVIGIAIVIAIILVIVFSFKT